MDTVTCADCGRPLRAFEAMPRSADGKLVHKCGCPAGGLGLEKPMSSNKAFDDKRSDTS